MPISCTVRQYVNGQGIKLCTRLCAKEFRIKKTPVEQTFILVPECCAEEVQAITQFLVFQCLLWSNVWVLVRIKFVLT
jgi:hypothetical protein